MTFPFDGGVHICIMHKGKLHHPQLYISFIILHTTYERSNTLLSSITFAKSWETSRNTACQVPPQEYPPDAITSCQFRESVLSQCCSHFLVSSHDEDEDEAILNYMNNKLFDYSGGHINGIFSELIRNSDFNSPQRDKKGMARNSLKQLFEECCAEADSNEPEAGGVNELEKLLRSYLSSCNRTSSSLLTMLERLPLSPVIGNSSQNGKVGRNIPMTHRRYNGKVHRVFNTHHYM